MPASPVTLLSLRMFKTFPALTSAKSKSAKSPRANTLNRLSASTARHSGPSHFCAETSVVPCVLRKILRAWISPPCELTRRIESPVDRLIWLPTSRPPVPSARTSIVPPVLADSEPVMRIGASRLVIVSVTGLAEESPLPVTLSEAKLTPPLVSSTASSIFT